MSETTKEQEFTEEQLEKIAQYSIDELLERYFETSTIMKDLEDDKKLMSFQIQRLLTTEAIDKYSSGEYRVNLVTTKRGYLDKMLLIENGVTTDVIEKSTKISTSTYPRVTKEK